MGVKRESIEDQARFKRESSRNQARIRTIFGNIAKRLFKGLLNRTGKGRWQVFRQGENFFPHRRKPVENAKSYPQTVGFGRLRRAYSSVENTPWAKGGEPLRKGWVG